jgi:O-antigen ligase
MVCGAYLGCRFALRDLAGIALVIGILLWVFIPLGGHGNVNFAAETIILLIPLCAGRWWPVGVAGVITALTMEPNLIKVAILGVLVAISFMWSRVAGMALIACAAGISALLAKYSHDVWYSVTSRLEIWWNTAIMGLDAPIFVHGMGSFNAIYPLYSERHAEIWPEWGTIMVPAIEYVGNPHNEVLFLWSVLGLPGLALVGALMVLIWRHNNGDSGALWAIFLGVCLSVVGFPLHNPGTALILAAACATLFSRSERLSLRGILGSRAGCNGASPSTSPLSVRQ